MMGMKTAYQGPYNTSREAFEAGWNAKEAALSPAPLEPVRLLPCLFCGGNVRLITENQNRINTIECLNCDAMMENGLCEIEELITQWNTRALSKKEG